MIHIRCSLTSSRVHIDTTAVLIHQMPVEFVKKPEKWNYAPLSMGEGGRGEREGEGGGGGGGVSGRGREKVREGGVRGRGGRGRGKVGGVHIMGNKGNTDGDMECDYYVHWVYVVLFMPHI